MNRFIKYTKKYYFQMLAAATASIGASAATVAVIDLLRQLIDCIAEGSLHDGFAVMVLKMAVIIVFGMLFNYYVVLLTGRIGSGLLKDLRNDALQGLLRVSPDFMSRNNFGDIMQRMSSDVETLAGFMQGYFKDCLYVPIIVIVYSSYLIQMKPLLAAVCLLPLAVLVPVSVKCLRPIKLKQFEYEKMLGMTNNNIQEACDGAEVIKAYNLYEQIEDKYYKALKETFDISNDTDLRQYNIEPVSAMIREVPLAAALCIGGCMAFSGTVSIGVLIAFISTIKKLIDPLSSAYQLVVRSQTAIVSVKRVFGIIDMPPEKAETAEIEFDKDTDKEIEFKNVSFAYNSENEAMQDNALRNISFTIRRGTKTALVGKSGSGKSTILKLISRQLEAGEGNIIYRGLDYSKISPKQVRENMALISQDTVLFPMSVFDNIRIGNPYAGKEEVMEAVRLAKCDDFINKMPEGIDSILDEKGENLSGGQKQRVAVARAVIKRADILLLDEPTSALDREAQEHISRTIDEISHGKTVITAAHRLITIKDYDLIIVVDNGNIVEYGSHDELMKMQGEYYRMYREYENSLK